jgi:hypothetical protein
MNVDETRTILEKVRQHDGRIVVTPQLIDDWQHALTRQTFEHCFDAVFDHIEQCGPRIALVPAEVLHHIRKARDARDEADRIQRAKERNESIFGSLHDDRADWEREAALASMRTGRAHLDQVLAARKASTDPARVDASPVVATP